MTIHRGKAPKSKQNQCTEGFSRMSSYFYSIKIRKAPFRALASHHIFAYRPRADLVFTIPLPVTAEKRAIKECTVSARKFFPENVYTYVLTFVLTYDIL